MRKVLIPAVVLLATACGVSTATTPLGGDLSPTATPTEGTTATPTPSPTESAAPPGVPAAAQPVEIKKVIDGDTIRLRAFGQAPSGPVKASRAITAQLQQIVTPARGQRHSKTADRRTSWLLDPGDTAYVEADTRLKDGRGRMLLHVWDEVGTWVNRDLARKGYGKVVKYGPNDHRIGAMRRAERQAKNAEKGIWKPLPKPKPKPKPKPDDPGDGGGRQVTPGAWCKKIEQGQIGYSSGKRYVCRPAKPGQQPRWMPM